MYQLVQALVLTDDADVLSLWPLLPLGDFKLNNLSLLQVPEALPGDSRVVNENIFAFLGSDESITFFPVKPLDSPLWHTLFLPPLGPVALDYGTLYTTAFRRILPPFTPGRGVVPPTPHRVWPVLRPERAERAGEPWATGADRWVPPGPH